MLDILRYFHATYSLQIPRPRLQPAPSNKKKCYIFNSEYQGHFYRSFPIHASMRELPTLLTLNFWGHSPPYERLFMGGAWRANSPKSSLHPSKLFSFYNV